MFKVKTVMSDNEYAPENHFFCKECGHFHSFFTVPPPTCKICSEPFPPLGRMAKDQWYRKMYYNCGSET